MEQDRELYLSVVRFVIKSPHSMRATALSVGVVGAVEDTLEDALKDMPAGERRTGVEEFLRRINSL